MEFDEILDQAITLLKRRGRLTHAALKRQFHLDDAYLADLTSELIDGQRVAIDEEGKVLVWVGEDHPQSTVPSREAEQMHSSKPSLSAVEGSEFHSQSDQSLSSPPQSPLSYTPPHLAERIRTTSITDGERKTITALFADLKGSTALIEGLDPEEARALIDPALQLMMNAVHRYEGYVAQALGDGIFALFGAPIAHEDHPQRALYAALLMQEDMRRYAETLRAKGYPPLLMRIGVNTGEVVMRSIHKDTEHTDYVPVGLSTNIAARMENLATPGTIVASEHTHRLTDGYFAFKSLGPTHVKGVTAPLTMYEVLGVGPLRTKLQVATRRGLAQFIGRQQELEALQRALTRAQAGHGQIVGMMGEPGVGKSRLLHEFLSAYCQTTQLLRLATFSVSHGKAYPYLPLIDLLTQYFQCTPHDEARQGRERIIGKVLALDRSLEDTVPYLLYLLGVAEATSPLSQMDPQIRRTRTLEAIKRVLLRESLNQPLLLIFEDVHWLDNETHACLRLLGDSLATARILLLINYRPEYRHEWGTKTYYTHLRLDPLADTEAEAMLAALFAEKIGPQQTATLHNLARFLLDKTEGNPFFMEEIVQALVEQGTIARIGEAGASSSHSLSVQLPPTVQAVLASRIDRLAAEEKALLQTVAVIGKEFPLSLVTQVADQSADAVQRVLSRLRDAEFIYEQPAFPQTAYVFKHALTQEVAYNSVLLERRKVLHEQTAHAIEDMYRQRLADHYSELAYHYSRSGNTPKAVHYLQRAGEQAVQRSANEEAVGHLTAALALLAHLPRTAEHRQQELALHIALGGPLIATKGYAAAAVEQTYRRVQELCREIGETPQLFSALWGLWYFYFARAQYQPALEFGEQCLTLANNLRDPALVMEAHFVLGGTLLLRGELITARDHYEAAVALYNPQQHRMLAFVYGQDPKVSSLSPMAWALWELGYPDRAVQRVYEALTLAQDLAHPYSLAFAHGFAAWIHQYRREADFAHRQAEAAIAISTEQGVPLWLAWGTITRGWARIEQGEGMAGIDEIRHGRAALQAMGAELQGSYFLALLADAHGKLGQPDEGLLALAEALAFVDKTGERYYEAELYRLEGELTLQRETGDWRLETSALPSQASSLKPLASNGAVEEAEGYFLKAIDISRKQQAKSLELRATMSLARLWQQQGKRTEAHRMLSEVYDWFTEGFDTKDLQEAKALLEELAAS